MDSIRLTVHGTPQSAGSKRAFMKPGMRYPVIVDDNPRSKGWKQQIASACREQYNGPLLQGPLTIELHFFMTRPRGHYGTGRNAESIKQSAPEWPAVKPDIDKLSRAVLDGLTGSLYRDDAQIVRKYAEKHYGDPARVEIMVALLSEPDTATQAEHPQLALVAA